LPVSMTSRFGASLLALLLFCRSSDSYEKSTLPDPRDPEFIEECVKTHNDFRSAVDPPASNMLYMTWDPDLAKTAKGWAKKCQFKHNTYIGHAEVHPRFRSIGENIWIGSVPAFTPKVAITSWKNEVRFYTYDTNSCSKICGHYTQVVWATSYKVGCAVHFCRKIKYSSARNAAYFVCNYGPPGNLPMRPYKTGAECSEC
ncbi:GLIP1 protein, partial [Origma solitaria]|nr:GLIP1 protein [Origma solitaria]